MAPNDAATNGDIFIRSHPGDPKHVYIGIFIGYYEIIIEIKTRAFNISYKFTIPWNLSLRNVVLWLYSGPGRIFL